MNIKRTLTVINVTFILLFLVTSNSYSQTPPPLSHVDIMNNTNCDMQIEMWTAGTSCSYGTNFGPIVPPGLTTISTNIANVTLAWIASYPTGGCGDGSWASYDPCTSTSHNGSSSCCDPWTITILSNAPSTPLVVEIN